MRPEEVRETGITPEMGRKLQEIENRHLRELVEMFGSLEGGLVQMMGYAIDGGKALKLTREQFHDFMMMLWDSAEAVEELVKTGRASGPEGYERLIRTVLGKGTLEVVKDET